MTLEAGSKGGSGTIAGLIIKPVDALLGLCVVIVTMARLALRRPHRDREKRSLLVIDTAYDLQALQSRGALAAVTSRDLNGFFERVWSSHPVVGASPMHRADASGPPRIVTLNDRHIFVEGHISWRPGGSRWPLLSLARAQAAYVRGIDALLASDGVDVVRCSDPYYAGLLGLVFARRYRAPLAIRISGNYDAIYEATGRTAYPRLIRSRRVERAMARFVLSRAALVLPANRNNMEFAMANGAVADRCVIIPAYGDVLSPIHLTEPSTRMRPSDLPERPFLLLISRLEAVKHPEDVLEVLAHLRQHDLDIGLVVAGDGSMRSELGSMADRLGISDFVRFMGDRSQEWIAAAAATCLAVLSPLTGRALVEGMLGGRPVVAYDVEWQREIVEHRSSGVLVRYRDHEAMATAVAELFADPASADEIGQAGRAAALDLVDPLVVGAIQREAYQRIIR